MDVGAEADVVGEVPADVVGIFVDDDVVAGPIPVVAIAEIRGGDAEIETVKPETGRAAAGEVPDMAFAEAPAEVAMLPRMILVEAGVFGARFMADPFALVIDVRARCRRAMLLSLRGRGMSFSTSWPMLGNGRMRSLRMSRLGMLLFFLRESW